MLPVYDVEFCNDLIKSPAIVASSWRQLNGILRSNMCIKASRLI